MIPNWKSPEPNLLQRFWLKNLSNVHERMAQQLNSCVQQGEVPGWMTKGRTVLLMKDRKKGNVARNYRPIT